MTLADAHNTPVQPPPDMRQTTRSPWWPARPTERWLLRFALILLGWHVFLLLALRSNILQLGSYLGIHFLGCAILTVWLIQRMKVSPAGDRYSAALQAIMWSAFVGPFGALIAMALSCPATSTRPEMFRESQHEDSMGGPAVERSERLHIALLNHRIRIAGASRIRPLMDVIAEGSQSQKLEALRIAYRRYESRLSNVLKQALQDPDTSVRVLAATVISKLHATYSQKIGEYQNAANAAPVPGEHWRTLAEARTSYAESGLLEPSRMLEQMDLAMSDLRRAIELSPDDPDSAALLATLRGKVAAWRTRT
jgi:hypothetical protein